MSDSKHRRYRHSNQKKGGTQEKEKQQKQGAADGQNKSRQKNSGHRRPDVNIYVPKVHEPLPECAICGEPIANIAEAIAEPDGRYSHFDCVVKKIAQTENLGPKQKVSYLGKGIFGIIETGETKNSFTIVKRITYEQPETLASMRSYVESVKE